MWKHRRDVSLELSMIAGSEPENVSRHSMGCPVLGGREGRMETGSRNVEWNGIYRGAAPLFFGSGGD